MMKLEQRLFKRGDEVALFEVGYKTPENGCPYMLDPSTRQLEEIRGEEFIDVEGTEVHRVETRSGMYEVDGTVVFAKRLAAYDRKE